MNGFKIVSATSFQDYLTQIARKRCQLQDMWMSCFDSQDGICQFLHRYVVLYFFQGSVYVSSINSFAYCMAAGLSIS